MIIVDAHEDLAWNIKTFGRDYTLPAAATRQREEGTLTPGLNGDTLLGYPDYRRGRVAVVFATLFAAPRRRLAGDWDGQVYDTPGQAHDMYRRQVEAYFDLIEDHPDHFRLVGSHKDLQETLAAWEPVDSEPVSVRKEAASEEEGDDAQEEADAAAAGGDREEEQAGEAPAGPPVGLVMLMEGAEGVRQPGELDEWWELGVRLIGPAWAGTRFCGGTREPGPLTQEGYALLDGMASLGFALDLSHMDEEAALQALDAYPGTVLASHSNAAALLKGVDTNRHLSQRLLRGLIERDGVIGVVPLNGFLVPGWKPHHGRAAVGLSLIVTQIDHICQMAGDARHAGLGTDFDGGYGLQSVPADIDTIADLQKLVPLLVEKGYSQDDIAAILGGNWLNCLRRFLPEVS